MPPGPGHLTLVEGLPFEFVCSQCLAEITHQLQPFTQVGVDFRSKELEAIFAIEFGMVHGGVRMLLQDLGPGTMLGVTTDANACANGIISFSNNNWRLQTVETVLSDAKSIRCFLQIFSFQSGEVLPRLRSIA